MKISVITVCLNDNDIEKTCKSVAEQTFQDFEWIVIDGGSNDETLNVLNKYRARMNVFVTEKDDGIYNAMNKGIRLATGGYIQFLNAGDCYFSDNSLEISHSNLSGEDIIYGDLQYLQEGKYYIKKSPDKIPYGWFASECLPHPASFIKKRLFDLYGFYDENLLVVSDFAKWIEWIDVYKCSYKHFSAVVSLHNFNGISSVMGKCHAKERADALEMYYPNYVANPTFRSIKLFNTKLLTFKRMGFYKKAYLFGVIPLPKYRMRKMKLGVSYNLFDGEELLPFSIKQIRAVTDYINVVYQTTSNFNQPANPELVETLAKLQREGLIDEIYHYEPNFTKSPRYNEIKKRDIGLNLAKKHRCTHFLSMDVDEFYDKLEFAKAKHRIYNDNIKSSALSIVEYLKTPENCLVKDYIFSYAFDNCYNYQVPFIINIEKFRKYKHACSCFPALVDPTRGVNIKGRFYLFPIQDIVMHHMSTVRRDLDKKFANSNLLDSPKDVQDYVEKIKQDIISFDFEASKINDDYALFGDKIVKKVANKFRIKF